MFTGTMTAEQVLVAYKDDVMKLAEYLPWIEEKSGKAVSSIYSGDGIGANSVKFPVYDAMLMQFIKAAENTAFMDRNYRYVYTRNRLMDADDEYRLIQSATILQMDQLGGIMSNYVLGGRTRARLWSDAMNYGIFYQVVKKAKELVDFWENAQPAKSEE